MDKEIVEGNKLIAEFMEKQDVLGILDTEPFVTNVWFSYDQIENKIAQGIRIELYYHTSWDWLMPVVEKIEAIRDENFGWFQVFIHSNACDIQSKASQGTMPNEQNDDKQNNLTK